MTISELTSLMHSTTSTTPALYPATLEHMGATRPPELSDLELERIHETIRLIPSDVDSVLDVGCGDGRVLRSLHPRYRSVGVDYSHNSVRQLAGRGVRASSATLPFSGHSFDLVLCCEVLEHLPEPVFRPTRRELERVARGHIIVCVPYRENLRLQHTRCSVCRTVFHVWGHLRRFSDRQLDTMFGGFEVAASCYFGPSAPYRSGVVLYVNQRFGGRWAEFEPFTMCPTCGNTSFTPTPRNPVTIACGLINLATSNLLPIPSKNWVLKLYSRIG